MFSIKRLSQIMILALAVAVISGSAWAAGSSETTSKPAGDPRYMEAERAVKSMDYRKAITLLEGVIKTAPGNADAFNYLGYSHRKLGEFDKAHAFYAKALDINPEHRGATEYLGELYLQQGSLAKAEKQLERLDNLCFWGCKELDTLKQAIADHRAKHKS